MEIDDLPQRPRRRAVRPPGLIPAYIPLPDGDGTILLLPAGDEADLEAA